MSTAIGPRAGLPREATTPFVVLALCWLPVGVVALIWVGGHTAALLTGHGWTGPDFGWDFARTLTGPDGVHTAWPRTPAALVWVCTGLLAATVTKRPRDFLLTSHRPRSSGLRDSRAGVWRCCRVPFSGRRQVREPLCKIRCLQANSARL